MECHKDGNEIYSSVDSINFHPVRFYDASRFHLKSLSISLIACTLLHITETCYRSEQNWWRVWFNLFIVSLLQLHHRIISTSGSDGTFNFWNLKNGKQLTVSPDSFSAILVLLCASTLCQCTCIHACIGYFIVFNLNAFINFNIFWCSILKKHCVCYNLITAA